MDRFHCSLPHLEAAKAAAHSTCRRGARGSCGFRGNGRRRQGWWLACLAGAGGGSGAGEAAAPGRSACRIDSGRCTSSSSSARCRFVASRRQHRDARPAPRSRTRTKREPPASRHTRPTARWDAIAAGPLGRPRTEAEVSRGRSGARLIDEGHDTADFAIVGSGPNGASPHHDASDRVMRPGEPVVLDLGGTLAGYGSDTTADRFGSRARRALEPDPEFRRV